MYEGGKIVAEIKKSIFINAPVEKVFDLALHQERIPEWLAGMEAVHDVPPGPPEVGTTYKWTYNMSGMRFQGTNTVTEIVPNARFVVQSTGGIDSTWIWTYEPREGGTLLTCEMSYTVPGGGLGKFADKLLVERTNVKNLERSLANIKKLIEG